MAIQTQEKMICGVLVYTTQLPPSKAFPLIPKLGQIMAAAFSKIDGAGALSMDSDLAKLGPAFAEFFLSLDSVGSMKLAQEILACTQAKSPAGIVTLNTVDNIDLAFSGNLKGLIETMRFALEVNFANFIDVGSLMQQLQSEPAAPEAVESPST